MLTRLEARARRWLRVVERGEWYLRLLGLPVCQGAANEPGLLMVQIDGLGHHHLQAAMAEGRMPFLRGLLEKEDFVLRELYPGAPATTPAMQGELFYGVRTAVPAFQYRDAASNQVVALYEPQAAWQVEERLRSRGAPLLEGGSAYADIFTGGAREPHFCSASMGVGEALRTVDPLRWVPVLLLHLGVVLRSLGLLVLELGLALWDGLRGLGEGESLAAELRMLVARVWLVVALREFVVSSVQMDLARGLPVVHANLIGYDEQAHHRGPSSRFARWTLRGIDDAVRRMSRAAWRSPRRDYEVWVYSDHGQADSRSYARIRGRPLVEAVEEAAGELLTVCAMGPVGHVYWPGAPPERAALQQMARHLVDRAGVPTVLLRGDPGEVLVAQPGRGAVLPRDGAAAFGADHPYLRDLVPDVVDLVHHPDAGHLVLVGWAPGGAPLSFADERGMHAATTPEETGGFAILPPSLRFTGVEVDYLRPLDLHREARVALGRQAPAEERPATAGAGDVLRVMSYNVHACTGTDGRISTERIARVIASYGADVVALQELDQHRPRTGGADQAHEIAERLRLHHHFHPAFEAEEGRYGVAVLSRFPIQVRHAGPLPSGRRAREPRGALWVGLDLGGRWVELLCTHLGLRREECRAQGEHLLGAGWLGAMDAAHPLVVCGDFNALPASWLCRRSPRILQDAQVGLSGHRPAATWPSRLPVLRLDHVLVGARLEVVQVKVPRTRLTRAASDHLPVVVDLRVR